jgi:RNA polymerase sigma-54 factor
MNAILEYQHSYFLEGDETRMRPMILKDIADMTNLDISTISSVVNSKNIQTHFGIYPLKYFFSEGMQTDSGEEVSTREIKKILQDCIDNEDKRKPLTDDKLSAILNDKGYQIARRTVAKYREQLGLSVARLRKEL